VEVCWATDLGLLQGSLTSNDKYHKWRTTIYKPNNSLINSSGDRTQWQVQKQKSRCALHAWNKSSSWVGSYKIARQRGQGYTLYWSKPVTWNIVPIHLSAVLGGSSPYFLKWIFQWFVLAQPPNIKCKSEHVLSCTMFQRLSCLQHIVETWTHHTSERMQVCQKYRNGWTGWNGPELLVGQLPKCLDEMTHAEGHSRETWEWQSDTKWHKVWRCDRMPSDPLSWLHFCILCCSPCSPADSIRTFRNGTKPCPWRLQLWSWQTVLCFFQTVSWNTQTESNRFFFWKGAGKPRSLFSGPCDNISFIIFTLSTLLLSWDLNPSQPRCSPRESECFASQTTFESVTVFQDVSGQTTGLQHSPWLRLGISWKQLCRLQPHTTIYIYMQYRVETRWDKMR
jgi:hypothetical protein